MHLDTVRAPDTAFHPSGFIHAFLTAITLLLLVSLNNSEAAAPRPPGKRLLLFIGSNTLGEFAVPELVKAYLEKEKKASNAKIEGSGELIFVTAKLPDGAPVFVEIHATGSGDCFKSFLGQYTAADQRCDIGMSSRRVTPQEAAAIKAKLGSDLFQRGTEPGGGCEHPVALDGLAIVVHQSNPLLRISFSELKAIYSRKTVDWKQLAEWKSAGGADTGAPIIPLRRKEPSGTLDFFKLRIAPDAAPMQDEKVIAPFTSSRTLAKQVAETPNAIGFIGESYTDQPGLKRLQVYDDSPQVMMKPEEASFPDRVVVRMGIYPLSRVVYFYTQLVSINREIVPFVKFALSEEGQAVIADKGNLVKIEGTYHQITKQEPLAMDIEKPAATNDGRKTRVILRLNGSNTVGAECAVNLAINYFTVVTKDSKPAPKIDDQTSALETPEGEKALAHDVMCDVDGDGTWETIQIRPTGSSDAFRDLFKGACDIGMSSRAIADAERRDLEPRFGNLSKPESQFALGLDALAIIVAKGNPLEKITVEQLRRVFLGEIKNWSELGGPNLPIQLHARPERSGTYKHFADSVLHGRSIATTAQRHAENTMVAEKVGQDPAGIGFVPMTKAGAAKVLKVGQEGSPSFAEPNEEAVRAGRYPAVLCRYVYFYVPDLIDNSPSVLARRNWQIAREFAEMSQSWRGQAIVASSGFITETQTADEAGQVRRIAGEPIQKYLQRLGDLEKKVQQQAVKLNPKLSNNEVCPQLLFEFNRGTLTSESRNIIDRKLGPWLKMYPSIVSAGLIAEGWADSVGTDEACQKISLERAENVATYITRTLRCNVTPVGKGKSFDPPNTSEENKQQNRRVVIKSTTIKSSTASAESALEKKPSAKRKPR
ncbi:MAG: phosphate ABC transporter substrate-binding/OmpA family protein [Chthoniobacteraceae bacterium]